MPGHNGGFNPYRDGNGEFTEPSQAGQPGRMRGKGGAGGIGRIAGGRPSPVGLGKVTYAGRGNPTASNINIARAQGQTVASSAAYRQKGRGITGQETAFGRASKSRP